MRFALILTTLLLAACGRTLTPAEQAFARAFHGPDIDPATVRFHQGLAPEHPRIIPERPRLTCQERIWPPWRSKSVEVTTGAMALFQSVHYRADLYRTDFLADLPEVLDLPDAMLFAHEMIHVWQWQNRATTGYHPIRAALEHVGSPDPYLFDPSEVRPFLAYGWEQQGSIMEEYVCCRALDPDGARTQRLHDMLSEHFDLPAPGRPLASAIRLPWDGVVTEGICS